MGTCQFCKETSSNISRELSLCLRCIREKPDKALPIGRAAHLRSRAAYGLPATPPQDPGGIPCQICGNECRMGEGSLGYCGLRENRDGIMTGVSHHAGKLSWYHDPLPTNCVADWVCAGGTGEGYPRYAFSPGPEHGYKNLAVFFHACSFDCLYCQNWQFRKETLRPRLSPIHQLVSNVDARTSCICYFGGDPSCQLPFALKASRQAREKTKGRILRICWETNGSMHPQLLDEMIGLSLDSGGCLKFDLKAWDENLHLILTGVSNQRTLENFSRAGKNLQKRPNPPLLVASTLLITGYIDENEVRSIARFIASISPEIPYCLLAFHGHFDMADLPLTPRGLALACREAAKEEGLRNIRIGNLHLLR